MSPTNSEILHGYYDEVINQKRLDLIPKYLSKNLIIHNVTYVGVGIMTDDLNGVQVIVLNVIPGSPADGKLMVGDELLRVDDGARTWETYEELRLFLWGPGPVGSSLTLWVLRGGIEYKITLFRDLIPGPEIPFHFIESSFPEFFKEWPDIKNQVVQVLESGDMVAYRLENQGYNTRYGRRAVWTEFGFMRIQDGMITELWALEDLLFQFKQLGYIVHEPVLKI